MTLFKFPNDHPDDDRCSALGIAAVRGVCINQEDKCLGVARFYHSELRSNSPICRMAGRTSVVVVVGVLTSKSAPHILK